MHHHQCWALNFSELDGKQKSKGIEEMVLSPVLPGQPPLSGAPCWWDHRHPLKNTLRNTNGLIEMKQRKNDNYLQVLLDMKCCWPVSLEMSVFLI